MPTPAGFPFANIFYAVTGFGGTSASFILYTVATFQGNGCTPPLPLLGRRSTATAARSHTLVLWSRESLQLHGLQLKLQYLGQIPLEETQFPYGRS